MGMLMYTRRDGDQGNPYPSPKAWADKKNFPSALSSIINVYDMPLQMLLPGKNKDALRLLEWVEHGRYPSSLLQSDHLH